MYKTMHNLKNKSKDKKGFTLAELLIVVAIIAVLVAIAIPIFSGQLEKAKEAADVANIRAAYAEAVLISLENDGGTAEYTSEATMQSTGDIDKIDAPTIGEFTVDKVEEGKKAKITINASGVASLSFVD